MKLDKILNITAGAVLGLSASAVAVAAQEVLRFGHVYEEATPYHAAMQKGNVLFLATNRRSNG